VNGFRIPIPYLVKDLTEMMHDPSPPIFPDNNTFPASINMDFNREEDADIIACVPEDNAYWWNRRVPTSVALQEKNLEFPQVTRQVINEHFRYFYHGVSHCFYNVFSQLTMLRKAVKVQLDGLMATGLSPKKTGDKFSVHGLAERPPAPVPQVSTVPAASQKIAASPAASDNPNLPTPISKATANIPLCPNCIPRQETLVAAFEQLRAAQHRVNAAITLGKEAVERSNAKIGAYDSLYNIYQKYGKPFQDGDRLPAEYMRDYPRHTHEDAIREGTRRRKEEERHKKEAKGKTSKKYDAGEEDRARPKRLDRGRPKPTRKQSVKHDRGHASTSRRSLPSDNGDESNETIPEKFRDSDRQFSDEESYNDDSEVDADWEMDPDADEE